MSSAISGLAATGVGRPVSAQLTGNSPGLRPGGTFLGSDSLPSDDLHQFHEGDTYNPVEPAAFLTRLQTTGFAAITLHVSHNLVFTARKAEDSP